jgi:hypothetical protein
MFLTDTGTQPYDLEKLFITLRHMMRRRGRDLLPAMETRLRTLARPTRQH